MIHSSAFKPRIIPIFADLSPADIDRLQELTATTTLNRTKIEEIGRDGIVAWRKTSPDVSLALRQMEYGTLDFWRKLANKSDAVDTIALTDFKTPAVDIVGYETDDDDTFLGSVYYPNARISGFGLAIGDPEALIERSFSLVGEDEIVLLNDNKYLIYKRGTVGAGANQTVTLDDPAPAIDQDNSGQYLFRVVRSRGGVATELTEGTEWSYDGVDSLTINGTSNALDVIMVVYSAASYIAGEDIFTLNDTDLAGITADSCSVFLESSNYLYRLQSVGVDTTFDRMDVKEIGNLDVVSRGIRDITNRVTLGRILEAYTIEEILRGKAGLDYGKIDMRELSEDLSLIIKIYEDDTKTTFKIGYKFTGLSPVSLDGGTPINDYVTRGISLEGEEGFITNQNDVL